MMRMISGFNLYGLAGSRTIRTVVDQTSDKEHIFFTILRDVGLSPTHHL